MRHAIHSLSTAFGAACRVVSALATIDTRPVTILEVRAYAGRQHSDYEEFDI